jgi:hypothetical protein
MSRHTFAFFFLSVCSISAKSDGYGIALYLVEARTVTSPGVE